MSSPPQLAASSVMLGATVWGYRHCESHIRTGFGGKSDRNNPARLHLLEHHLADVGGPSGIMSLHHHRGAFVHPCQHTTTVVH